MISTTSHIGYLLEARDSVECWLETDARLIAHLTTADQVWIVKLVLGEVNAELTAVHAAPEVALAVSGDSGRMAASAGDELDSLAAEERDLAGAVEVDSGCGARTVRVRPSLAVAVETPRPDLVTAVDSEGVPISGEDRCDGAFELDLMGPECLVPATGGDAAAQAVLIRNSPGIEFAGD